MAVGLICFRRHLVRSGNIACASMNDESGFEARRRPCLFFVFHNSGLGDSSVYEADGTCTINISFRARWDSVPSKWHEGSWEVEECLSVSVVPRHHDRPHPLQCPVLRCLIAVCLSFKRLDHDAGCITV